jgi:hypothetical protein
MKGNGKDEEFKNVGDFEGLDDTDELLDDELYTVLDDAGREELEELVGLKVVDFDVWEESLSDTEDEEPVKPEDREFFDCDLLFADGLALELIAAAAYPDPDSEDPIKGIDTITAAIEKFVDQQLELLDFDQADEESPLMLAFGSNGQTRFVLTASAWLVSEWEEDDEEEDDENGDA